MRLRKLVCWSCGSFSRLYEVVEEIIGGEEANERGGWYCRSCADMVLKQEKKDEEG